MVNRIAVVSGKKFFQFCMEDIESLSNNKNHLLVSLDVKRTLGEMYGSFKSCAKELFFMPISFFGCNLLIKIYQSVDFIIMLPLSE